MTSTEQVKIELAAPRYLRNVMVIVSEIGLRHIKELLPMKKEQVDLENWMVHIGDSKTLAGIGDMPQKKAQVRFFSLYELKPAERWRWSPTVW